MNPLNEFIVEAPAQASACLHAYTHRQIKVLSYAVGHRPHLALGEFEEVWDSFGQVMFVGRLREMNEWPTSAISEDSRANGKRFLQVRFERMRDT